MALTRKNLTLDAGLMARPIVFDATVLVATIRFLLHPTTTAARCYPPLKSGIIDRACLPRE